MSEQPNYYGILPASVRYDKSVPPAARLLYSELTALCNKHGYCFAGNEYFAELYDVSPETVSRWISKLARARHIVVTIDQAANEKRRIYMVEEAYKLGLIGQPLDEKIKRPLDKNVNNLLTKTSTPLDKKIKHNINSNITDNNTSYINAQSAFSPLPENESDYVQIQTWTAETAIIPLNIASLKQDTPGGGVPLNQYADTDEQLLKERDPKPARANKKNTTEEPPKGMSMAEFIKPIERLNAELQKHFNMPGHTFCRLNVNGNLKKLKRLFKETGCSPDEAAEVVAYIVGKWAGTKFQDNLTPDTLFAPSNFAKYRGWYQMNKTAPAKPQTPTTPARRVQMDEPDFEMYKGKQAF